MQLIARMSTWLRRMDGAELWGVALLASFVFAASAGPLAVSMAVSPEQIERGAVRLSPPCPIRTQTGEGCPTCGLTRAFTAMSRLRVHDARAYNAAAPWVYLAFVGSALSSGGLLGRVGWEARLRRTRA
jgi:uncharacterized protein DUF2752